MINRMKNRDRRARKKIIDEAVGKSRVPGQSAQGATPSPGALLIAPGTIPDADGNTLHALLWDIDSWDNAFWS